MFLIFTKLFDIQIQKMSGLIIISIFLLILNGCQKQPEAIFSLDESVFIIGEPVYFVNHSTDASGYLWDFGDGNTSTETSPEHTFTDTGFFMVILTAYSENGKKSDEMTSNIVVSLFFSSPIEGSIFYSGSQHFISWNYGLFEDYIYALYILKGGNYIYAITTGTSLDYFYWNVPDALSTDTTYQIKVKVLSDPEKSFYSDYFTIIN